MKEQRYFYTPEPEALELPGEEAQHAVRVLRLGMGDELNLVDGHGGFYTAVITEASNHHCRYRITGKIPQQPEWKGSIAVAVAPTKNMDRIEWFVEKATEIGVDDIVMLECQFSERRMIKTERLEKVAIAAMKQSHKAWKPQIEGMTDFMHFIAREDLPRQRFIAHCYDQTDIKPDGVAEKPFLADVLESGEPALVMVGPEGDFSVDEVRAAESAGFRSITLGTSRLRTETAALVAVHLMRITNQ